LLLLAGCAHTDIALNSGAPPAAGTSVVSGSAGLHVNASGAAAAAFVALGVVAAAIADLRNPRPGAPQMDPGRTVSDQDCSKPIESVGNLRCR